jgi:hypothetical protein
MNKNRNTNNYKPMNEEIKRKCDELVEKHLSEIPIMTTLFSVRENLANEHAILSTKNTIEVLNKLSSKLILNPQLQYAFDEVAFLAYEQTEILTELESRV